MTDPFSREFDLFDQYLQPSAQQREMAKVRSHHISDFLSRDTKVVECRLVGSIARTTSIRRFSDVDILAAFDPKEMKPENSQQLLDRVEQMLGALGKPIIRTPVAISLEYSDWPSIDIIPGWTMDDGRSQIFRISTETNGAWQFYSPDQHDRLVHDASARLGPQFKKIVRMIKWWNQINSKPLESFKIEADVSNLFPVRIPNYPEAIYTIFNDLINRLTDGQFGSDGGLDMSAAVPVSVKNAWLISQQAQELALSGRREEGVGSLFRRLFGEQFPLVRS